MTNKKTNQSSIKDFCSVFNDLLKSAKRNDMNCNNTIFEKNIYEGIGISRATFDNYKNGKRNPFGDELKKIHDYFDVSYSYLFGESNVKSHTNKTLIDMGITLGLNEESIFKLHKLKKKANNETIEDNFQSYIKLFLINNLINDEKSLNSLCDFFSITLGRNILDNKFKNNPKFKSFSTSDSIYDMTKYAIMTNWINNIEKITKEENVQANIKNRAEQYAIKYAGDMQPIIKDILK